MTMLVFTMVFMPLMVIAMATFGMMQGLKKRAIYQKQRSIRDQQRFLQKGYLRKGWG